MTSTANARLSNSAVLIELDDVSVRIAHEDRLRSGLEPDGAAAERETRRFEPLLGRRDVIAPQREVSDAWVLLGDIHQDVRLARRRCVKHEVDLHAGRMVEDRDRFRSDRTGSLPEAEQLVE